MINNRRQTQEEFFRRRGIKTRAEAREEQNFVGKQSRSTFSQMQDRMIARFTPGSSNVAVLGEAYSPAYYGRGERVYEDVYGTTDYSKVVSEDPTRRETLNTVFGGNDNGTTSSFSEEEARTVLGVGGATSPNSRALIEKHRSMYRNQNNTNGVSDESSRGIRGLEDYDAAIEPIA